jgi:hypothetical protein
MVPSKPVVFNVPELVVSLGIEAMVDDWGYIVYFLVASLVEILLKENVFPLEYVMGVLIDIVEGVRVGSIVTRVPYNETTIPVSKLAFVVT